MTDNVPDGALQTNPDGSVPAFDADGNPVGTVDPATVAAVIGNASQGDGNGQVVPENGQNGQNSASDEENEVIVPQSKMKMTTKVLANCAKVVYNDSAILVKAHFVRNS